MIAFAHPEILWLLLLLPFLLLMRGRSGPSPALRFPSVQGLKSIASFRKTSLGRLTLPLRTLTLATLIIAMARPQLLHGRSEVEASGIDIVLAIDVSSSMESLDFHLNGKAVSRLDVVKKVVSRFIDERPNDRIGIIAFASRPYMLSPLTLDHDWLQQRLEQLKIGSVEDGTAIGSAIASATNRLREQDSKSRIIILLTDGINNAGKVEPLTAAEAAKALSVKIYTIGAGTRGLAPVPAIDPFGRKVYVQAQVDIDEKTLQKIADMSKGEYYRATDTSSLENIYEQINKLETTTRILRSFQIKKEEFAWPLCAALLFIVAEFLLRQVWRPRLP